MAGRERLPETEGAAKMNCSHNVTKLEISSLKPHPLNAEIYGQQQDVSDLVQSITEFGGIREPLQVNKSKTIISGHRRWLAARQAGLKTVPVTYVGPFKDEQAELRAILLANQYRKKTNEQRVREGLAVLDLESELAAARSKRGKKFASDPMEKIPGGSAKACGTTRDKVATLVGIGCGKNFDKGSKAVHLIDELISRKELLAAEGVRRELNRNFAAGYKVVKRYKVAREETAKLLELIGSDKAKDYDDAFDKSLRSKAAKIPANLPKATDRYRVHQGDILKVGKRIRKSLIDAKNLTIIVDIPYVSKPYGEGTGDDWKEAAKKVARFAIDYLPLQGSLLVMTGQYWLPGVLDALRAEPDLSYYWTYAVVMPGKSRRQAKRNVNVQWKPIIHFVKGPASDGNGSLIRSRIISDVIRSEPLKKEERLDEWQQPKIPFEILIDAFTKPGDVVVDPMMGSGTTGVVAIERKRKFIGIEIDGSRFRLAQKRLQDTAKILAATERRGGRKKRRGTAKASTKLSRVKATNRPCRKKK